MKPFMQRLWWRGRHFRDLRRAINEPWQDWADNVSEASTGLSAYAVNGSDPATVADFAGTLNSGTPYFRVGGSTSSFASMFSFSRASAATYTNSSGNLVSATSGTARTDHYRWNGSSYVRAGILLESAAATNLEINSANPAAGLTGNVNATWTQTGATARDGSTTMYRLLGNSTLGQHYRAFNNAGISFTSGTTYCLGVDLSPVGSQQYVTLGYTAGRFGATARFVIFDLINGTVALEQTNCKGFIDEVSDGIFRCSMTAPATSSGTGADVYYVVLNSDGSTPVGSYSGSTSDGVDCWGFNVVAATAPSSHIPTSGATATRAAETDTAAGSDLDASTTAMSFHLAGREAYADLATAGQVELFDWRVDANNRITVTIDTDGAKTGTITLTMVNGGSSASVAATTQLTPGVNKAFNVAWRVTGSEINIALNGAAATATATAIGVPDLSSAAAAFEGRGTRSIFRQAAADWTDSGIESASS